MSDDRANTGKYRPGDRVYVEADFGGGSIASDATVVGVGAVGLLVGVDTTGNDMYVAIHELTRAKHG